MTDAGFRTRINGGHDYQWHWRNILRRRDVLIIFASSINVLLFRWRYRLAALMIIGTLLFPETHQLIKALVAHRRPKALTDLRTKYQAIREYLKMKREASHFFRFQKCHRVNAAKMVLRPIFTRGIIRIVRTQASDDISAYHRQR